MHFSESNVVAEYFTSIWPLVSSEITEFDNSYFPVLFEADALRNSNISQDKYTISMQKNNTEMLSISVENTLYAIRHTGTLKSIAIPLIIKECSWRCNKVQHFFAPLREMILHYALSTFVGTCT